MVGNYIINVDFKTYSINKQVSHPYTQIHDPLTNHRSIKDGLYMENIHALVLIELKRCMFHFLWVGSNGQQKIHLMNWESISLPPSMGTWGIKNLF